MGLLKKKRFNLEKQKIGDGPTILFAKISTFLETPKYPLKQWRDNPKKKQWRD
jgi:hypothetical protein